MQRPSTTVVLAMTADGKITDVERSPAKFSSATDKAHLEQQIALVDGVLFGAGTLRAYGTTFPLSNPQIQQRKQLLKPPQPVQIVCSASAKIDPELQFFRQSVPRWLLTTTAGAKLWQGKEEFERILIADAEDRETREQGSRGAEGQGSRGEKGKFTDSQLPKSIDWMKAFVQLAQLRLQKLAILGGGELVASLLAADLIDEWWLTVCPLILGGATAPTPVEGAGFCVGQAQRLELLSVQQVEGEIFLHYRVQR